MISVAAQRNGGPKPGEATEVYGRAVHWHSVDGSATDMRIEELQRNSAECYALEKHRAARRGNGKAWLIIAMEMQIVALHCSEME